MKTWEEETKLNHSEIMIIIMYIVISIFNIFVLIQTKNIAYISNILLWWTLAFTQYMDIRIRKGKDAIIEIQDNTIDEQHDVIIDLSSRLLKQREFIKLSDIKISKKFTKPRTEKLDHRTEYYRVYKNFEVPIILDKNNVLVDGYTTYLIARKEGFSHIYIERKTK